MKTIAWTPSPLLKDIEYSIEDEAIFFALESKTTKRVTLIGALLAAAAYAAMNLGFEIRNKSQEVLVVFEPGHQVKGYPAIVQALFEVSVHLDNHAKFAVSRVVEGLKPQAVRLYEQGVNDGIQAQREGRVPAVAQDDTSAGSDADTAGQLHPEGDDAPGSEAAPNHVG